MGNITTKIAIGVGTAAVLMACGGGGGGTKEAKKPAQADIAPPAGGSHSLPEMTGTVTCLGGTVTVNKSPAGSYYLRQAWDATSKTLTQDSVLWDGKKATRQWAITKQEGEKDLVVTGKYPGGTFKGTGVTMMGSVTPENIWPTWMTTVEMDVGGTTVKSQHAATAGSFVGHSKVGANLTFVVKAKTIDEATCKQVFSTFAPL